ncbi:MAG TPA: helix-turn-helix transcriptional regulator [Clostridia bacterium]|nr:helix-turn-helix transcriptional regulator [Clostridia bacterium]
MHRRSFAEALQELRKGMNLTQKDFADFLAMSQATISAYENDRISPTLEVLVNIAQKCKVSVDWLCGLTDTEKSLSNLREWESSNVVKAVDDAYFKARGVLSNIDLASTRGYAQALYQIGCITDKTYCRIIFIANRTLHKSRINRAR